MSGDVERLEAIIAENARLLGQDPSIGVHVLRDGRVRIYQLALGWRRSPYTEYRSIKAAAKAADIANRRAQRVAVHRAAGWSESTAISMALDEVRA